MNDSIVEVVKQDTLDDWFERPAGRLLFDYELTLVNEILASMYGYYLLQPSVPNHFLQRRAETIVQSVTIHCPDPCIESDKPTFWGEQDALPILSNTIDMVLLPHVLEFSDNPDSVLQEYYRVLKPDGYMIILGFNPMSLFGLYRLLGRRRYRCPWRGKFLSKAKLLKQLTQMACKISQTQNFGFYYPGLRHTASPCAQKIEQMAQVCLPMFGSSYLVVAQKKVVPLTLIKPRWKKTLPLTRKLVQSSVRRQSKT